MRKIYSAFLSLLFLLAWNSQSMAQVNNYGFVQSSGTYTPIAGTTVHASGWDDNAVVSTTIPFSFTFNGTAYTAVNVSSNGFLTFGATVPSTVNYIPVSNVAAYSGAVAVFGRDLISNVSTIVQTTQGSAPNRQFVVQWNNARRYNGGPVVGDVLNFQIILNETSNTVQVVYGTCTATSATALTCEVGLRGTTNADFNNRTTTTDWSTTTGGGTNNASCTSSNTIMPVSGLTFTWLPPGPCVPGSLGGGTTQGPAGTVCPGVSFTLSVTGASFGTGLTYSWESSPDNIVWTPVVPAVTTATYTTSINTNTYFRRKITCSTTDAWSSSLLVSVTGPASIPFSETFASYATTFPPTCWTRNNTTFLTGQAPSAYGIGSGSSKFDFYNAAAGTQLDLVSPLFTAVPAGYFLIFDHAYATFAGEVDQLQILYSTNGGTSYTNLVTYLGGTAGPLNTIGGGTFAAFSPTAAQWATKFIALPAGTNKLLFRGVSAFGNNLFLDNIVLTSCLPPTGLTLSAVAPTTATLSWTASASAPSGGYQWEVRTSGAAGSGATGLTASGPTAAGITTANVTGLTPNTAYTYYVRSSCGGPDFSIWAAYTFTTPCSAIAIPFLENFATYAATFPPTCWTRNNITLLTGQAPSAYGVGLGSSKFDFYTAAAGTQLDLVSPLFTPVPAGYFLIFDHAYATFAGEVDQLQILYSTNGGTSYTNLVTYLGGTAGPLNTIGGGTFAIFSPTAAQWGTKFIALPAGTNKLIFRGVSAFGNNLFLDNIALTSCLPPTGLGLSAIAPTTATLSWTASGSAPSNGYQWEVRTSGTGGSGATGLVASGATAAGVTTANVTGLTTFTAYSYYVRSDCGGSFSIWAGPYAFTTPCNPIAIPFTETFATYASTFPPTCWTRNNTTFLTGQAPSAYGIGLGSAKFDFYNAAAGTQLDLVSPLFAPSPAGWGLIFDHAYATFFGENDQLQILYSTNGGGSYSTLISYAGGAAGPLNTAGAVLPAFSPTAAQWANKAITLPTGTNRLLFKGISAFGNNLFLDNIALVSCLPPTNVKALGTSPTTVQVSFTAPVGAYIIEYGLPGFTPGTTNAAGPGGSIVFTGTSPFTIGALTASTTYDFYVRRICTPGVDYSINVKATATTLCPATNIPYLQNFESAAVPGMPTCTSVQDVNGNSGSFWLGTGGGSWETYTDANPLSYVSPSKSLLYYYDFNDLTRGGDDWFYIQGLNLTGGTSYRLKFFYKAIDGVTYPEKMEVKYGKFALADSMVTGTLFTNNNISSVYGNSTFDSVRVDFTPPSTGVYYIGFHAASNPDEFGILLDDVSVKIAPLVDVGISGITLPSLNCPTTSGVFVQATITNYNTTTVNFATYPVTVTANISNGGPPTVLTALLNTGTLAPGASMGIYLSPAFNFSSGGTYNITVATSSPFDLETANDAYTTSITVNPNPPTPVITPSAPAICLGNPVLLSTQFAPSPPAVTLPAISSGTISIPVPDGSAAGATHSLIVSGVPAGASITAMSVTLDMTHTWAGDMIFNLKAPNGNILNLDKYIGGTDAAGFNFTGTVISSAGVNALSSAPAPRTGTFKPDAINTALAAFAIQNPTGYVSNVATFAGLYSVPNGTWTLAMADGVGFDVGTLTSWSITITYQILTPVITWTPATGLYTDAGATTAYTGGNAFSLYANPPATTTYTVTATTAAGCTSSATATVTVNPYPVITIGSIPDTVCTSDPLIPLVASPVGGTWTGIGVSGTNFVPPATAVGTYTLTYTYTNAFGCTTTATKKIAVKDCPERMILLRDNAIILYPNPNNGQFNIRINSVLYNNLSMRVYTNSGMLVRTQQIGGLAWGRVVPIDLTNLPGGLYMVKFYYDGGPRTSEKTFNVIIGTE